MDSKFSFNGSGDKSHQKEAHRQKSNLIYTGSYSYKAKTETVNVVPQAIPTAQVFAPGPDQGMNQQHFLGNHKYYLFYYYLFTTYFLYNFYYLF